MRAPLAVTVLLLAAAPVVSTPAKAQALYEGPWCAYVGIGDDSYVERCDMRSYEMCRSEIFAQGGAYCTQNPRYKGAASAPAKQRRKATQRKKQRDNR